MKTIRMVVVLSFLVAMTGCATGGAYSNTGTGVTAGGLLGAGLAKAAGRSANKGAIAGGLIGAGIGVLMDSQEKKDNERAEKAKELIYNQTGGGDSSATEARLKAQRNLAFAEKKRRECEAEFGAYREAGENWPHDCQQVRREALATAKYVTDTNSPEVFYEGMRGNSSYAINQNTSYVSQERQRRKAYWDCWGPGGSCVDNYNRQHGYYGYRRY